MRRCNRARSIPSLATCGSWDLEPCAQTLIVVARDLEQELCEQLFRWSTKNSPRFRFFKRVSRLGLFTRSWGRASSRIASSTHMVRIPRGTRSGIRSSCDTPPVPAGPRGPSTSVVRATNRVASIDSWSVGKKHRGHESLPPRFPPRPPPFCFLPGVAVRSNGPGTR